MSSYLLPYAEIEWLEDQTPYSPQFDDIYWSRDNGLAEKQHVFIDANKLEQRWQRLKPGDQFTILETGFGFGLNFHLATSLWRSIKPLQATLHYVAFEQYLVSPDDLKILNEQLTNHPLQSLIDKYPRPIPGTHHIWLEENICLTLIIGNITETLPAFNAKVDACFLDGFSPSKNDQMWLTSSYAKISELMRPGATLSSYSVAGHVRRGLSATGLKITKQPGHGRKAEMMVGEKPQTWQPRKERSGKIVIIGAGLAGLHCVLALKRRNLTFDWYEASADPLGAVKNIQQVAIYPQLSASPEKPGLLSLSAFEFFIRHINYHRSGRLQLFSSLREKQKALKLTHQLPSSLLQLVSESDQAFFTELGTNAIKHQDALYFPTAGWLDPTELSSQVENLIQYHHQVTRLEKQGSGWLIHFTHGEVKQADKIIIATGSDQMELISPLKLVPVRGQSLSLKTTAATRTVVSQGVSIFPSHKGISTLSGTFARDNDNQEITTEDTDQLLFELQKFYNLEDQIEVRANVGIRATTRDRMPVVGPLPDWKALEIFCNLPEVTRQRQPFDQNHEGLFCAVGFGSHGATHAPYCAEYLIRLMNQEPVTELPELSATRFHFRDVGIKF